MSEPARKPNPKFPHWVRRICLLLVIAGVVTVLTGYYVYRHLPDVMVALVRRAAPNMRTSVERVALVSLNRVELRNFSLRLRQGNVEILHLSRAAIDFSLNGLRKRRIDAVIVDDPVVRVNEELLKQCSPDLSHDEKREPTRSWTLGMCAIRGGKARLDVPAFPLVQFEFSSGPQTQTGAIKTTPSPPMQCLEFNHIEITGRDGDAPSRAKIKSVATRFAIEEIASGHLKELIVQNPSLQLTPEVMNYLPQKSAAQNATLGITEAGFRVDRLLIEHGDLQLSGFGASVPKASFKFGIDTTDVRMGDAAEKLHHAQLWEIALWPGLRIDAYARARGVVRGATTTPQAVNPSPPPG